MDDKKKKLIIIVIVFIVLCIVAIGIVIRNNAKKKKSSDNSIANVPLYNSNTTYDKNNDDLNISYQEDVVKNISVGDSKYVCKENKIELQGLDKEVADKINEYLKGVYADLWKEIESNTSESEIRNLLEERADNKNNEEIGFKISSNIIFKSEFIITVSSELTGGLGGVSWNKANYVSFNRKNGDVVTPADAVIVPDEYIEKCENYVLKQIKTSKHDRLFVSDYEKIVHEELKKMEGYFTEDGIVCLQIPGDKITNDYTDVFSYTIPYDLVNTVVYSNYLN